MDNWVSIDDQKPSKDNTTLDFSIIVEMKVPKARGGYFTRKGYFDFFLSKWFWQKRDGTTLPVNPTHWRFAN